MTEHTADEFNAKFETFLAGCARISQEHSAKHFPNNENSVFSYERGQRYIRVVRSDYGARSVHCFVDTTTGDVLKAAGWRAPAKGVRGNIFDDKNGLGRMGPYGTAYNR